ncbi:glycosyltransferase family 2 protein [Sphingomonas melonis]|uniref:glycosyltransferase family 2 protein n=1 Tax=Sphingomonas melonis TaxID=152682 RepID=UPI00369A31E7
MLHILIPVFNNPEGLAASLRSIPDDAVIPIIVVDNASTDQTATVLQEATAARRHLHVVRNPANLGRIGNWNRCLEVAESLSARHILFIMAGDRFLADHHRDAIAALSDQDRADTAVTLFPILTERGDHVTLVRDLSLKGIRDRATLLDALFRYGVPFLGPLQACAISSADSRFGRFDEAAGQYHADQDYVASRVLDAQAVVIASTPITAMNLAQRKTHGTVKRTDLLHQDLAFMRSIHQRAWQTPPSILRHAIWYLANIYRYFGRRNTDAR